MSKIIVLFSSGEYSDYGLSGLRYVDKEAYEKTRAAYDSLGQESKNIREIIRKRRRAKDITEKEIESLSVEADKSKQMHDLWEILMESGEPVEFEEFWNGVYY